MSSHRAPTEIQPVSRKKKAAITAAITAAVVLLGLLIVDPFSPAGAATTPRRLAAIVEDPRVTEARGKVADYCNDLVNNAKTTRQRNTRADLCAMWTGELADRLGATTPPPTTVPPTTTPPTTTAPPTTPPPTTTNPPVTTPAATTTPPVTTAPPTTAPPTTPPPGAGAFTIGVFLQDPLRERFGQNNALNYKNAGINTFVAQWEFPSRADSQARVDAIHAAGLRVWAGGENGSVTQAATAKSYGVDGYFIGDEQDMFKANTGGCCTSTVFLTQATNIHNFDPTRPVANNFGKSFSLYPWEGYHCDNGVVTCSGELTELQRYCSAVDRPSSDYYAAVDPWEALALHTPRYYGLAIDHMRTICGTSKPLLGFIETGHPIGHGPNDNPGCPACEFGNASWPGMSVDGYITPDAMERGIWSMLAHGADGIIYFSHDFIYGGAEGDNLIAEDGMLTHPDILARAKQINGDLVRFDKILTAPRQATGMSIGPSVDAAYRIDNAGNRYVIAAESMGAAGYRSITIAGAAGHTVEVIGENRTLTADPAGTFTDTYEAWGHHLYQVK